MQSPDWAALPATCLEKIFSFVPADGEYRLLRMRLSARRVCKRWAAVPLRTLRVPDLSKSPGPGFLKSVLKLLRSDVCSQLHEFILDGEELTGSTQAVVFFEMMHVAGPRLRKLTLHIYDNFDFDPSMLLYNRFPGLTSLDLHMETPDDILDFSPLAALTTLVSLEIHGSFNFFPAPMPALASLKLEGGSFGLPFGGDTSGNLSGLTHLSLRLPLPPSLNNQLSALPGVAKPPGGTPFVLGIHTATDTRNHRADMTHAAALQRALPTCTVVFDWMYDNHFRGL